MMKTKASPKPDGRTCAKPGNRKKRIASIIKSTILPTMTHSAKHFADDYARIEQAIRYIENHFPNQPNLDEIAAQSGLSTFHFQRTFKRWAGISPKRFLQFITSAHAARLLRESKSNLDVAISTGLSSTSRLHDLMVNVNAMTPGQFKNHGQNLSISFGTHPTPFGTCLIATTDTGICHLGFFSAPQRGAVIDDLKKKWHQAQFSQDQATTAILAERIFQNGTSSTLQLHVSGTNFQIKVWQALLNVPIGNLISYQALAQVAGYAKASRAVGSAMARNPVAYLIPCHRVVRQSGLIGNYRWGTARKKAIIAWESAKLLDPKYLKLN